MRTPLLGVVTATLWTAAAVACATSNDLDPPAEGDGGPSTVPDGGSPEDAAPSERKDAGDASDASDGPLCSTAGWCKVPLPDEILSMIDIWPLGNRAFGVAKNPYFGTKVLEWDGATGQWKYVDDDSQNEVAENGAVREPYSIWAPNDDEIYYTVATKSSGYVYHGRRPVPPSTAWTWTRSLFVTCDAAKLWVYGTSSNDVYAATCNAIYRAAPDVDAGNDEDGGAPAGWLVDRLESEPASTAVFIGASGVGPDDVWFAGTRQPTGSTVACSLLLHRTAAGYEEVVDAIASSSGCSKKEGRLLIGGAPSFVRRTGDDRVVFMNGARTPTRVARDLDGGYALQFSKTPSPGLIKAAWVPSEDDLWVSMEYTGQVMRGGAVWGDGGSYQFSSIALNGSPTLTPMRQIRGTSNTNLWAVGGNYVFHKTTP